MTHGAGCLCGAVRVTIDAEPIRARICWCRLCQYLAAGNATVNLLFPAAAVAFTGEVRWRVDLADSGNRMRRGFCPECGTPIFSRPDAESGLIIVRAGALDNPDLLAPQGTIWTSEAPCWAYIDPDLPAFEHQPPPVG